MVLRRTRLRDDEGSLILAMLAIIVVGGLLLVIGATVLAGQTQTRFDRNFEQALEVAETGLSQMTSLVQSNPAGSPVDVPSMTNTATAATDGGTYTVSAAKNGFLWTITSTGTAPDGTARTVEQQVRSRPLFGLAAFGRTSVDFQGGNGADAFTSTLDPASRDICLMGSSGIKADAGIPTNADSTQTDVNMCTRAPGLGTVATNGELDLKGGVAGKVDRAEVHNAQGIAPYVVDPLPDATGVCKGVTATCDLFTAAAPKGFYYREPIELPAITSCNLPGTPVPFAGNGTFENRAYNLSDVTLSGATRFTGTVDQPTILCVSGRLDVVNANLINFEQAADGRWVPRRPGTLFIFVTGTGNSTVTMGNNASISAAIYAPNAAIVCGPQGNVYGSLVANSINNAGGWNFHYDTVLGDQQLNAAVRVQNWREVR